MIILQHKKTISQPQGFVVGITEYSCICGGYLSWNSERYLHKKLHKQKDMETRIISCSFCDNKEKAVIIDEEAIIRNKGDWIVPKGQSLGDV